jgi:hypothetical protein
MRGVGAIAYQNKAVVYDLLFKASAETLLTIAADPKRLGVEGGRVSDPITDRQRAASAKLRALDRAIACELGYLGLAWRRLADDHHGRPRGIHRDADELPAGSWNRRDPDRKSSTLDR